MISSNICLIAQTLLLECEAGDHVVVDSLAKDPHQFMFTVVLMVDLNKLACF